MTGMAAGMAPVRLRPITYTITPFVTTRCLEQIRVDVCYHELPVVIVGVGAGLSYAALGATHHACEDIAFMRGAAGHDRGLSRPTPSRCGWHSGRHSVRTGRCIFAWARRASRVVHATEPDFAIGRAIVVRPGRTVCLLATGTIVPVALEAAEELARRGIDAEVVSFHTVKPLDEARLRHAFTTFAVVATVEEHSVIGGLGGAVAEWLADHGPYPARLVRFGTRDTFVHESGDQDHARAYFGLTAASIAATLQAALHRESAADRPREPAAPARAAIREDKG